MNAPTNSILARVFGPVERRLFGVFHPGAEAASERSGVLLCNAFGQEGVRAHRMMRVLAERLARAGHPVLRFDYHGTGDSMGDDEDGDLAGWAGDIHVADHELRRLAGVSATAWVGMRLGGTVALAAARAAPDTLSRLVLWDPVLDGTAYLQRLRERHVVSLEEAFSLTPVPAPSVLARDPSQFRDEAIGFALPPLLRQQLAEVSPQSVQWPPQPASIVALTDPDDADGRDLAAACARQPGRVRVVAVRHGTDWTTDSADNSALVPGPALMQLVQQIGAAA